MINLKQYFAVTLAMLLLAACGATDPVEKALDHQIAILKIAAANGADYEKAQVELKAYGETHEADFQTIRQGLAAIPQTIVDNPNRLKELEAQTAAKRAEVDTLRKGLVHTGQPFVRDHAMRELLAGLEIRVSPDEVLGVIDPFKSALTHEIALLKLVLANKTDAAKATSALEAHIAANEAELRVVREALATMKAELEESKDMGKIADIMKANAEKIKEVSDLKEKLRAEAKDVYNDDRVRELLRSTRAM